MQNYSDKVRQDAEIRLHQIAKDARLIANWHPVIIHGNAVQKILEQDDKQSPDLIIIGKYGLGMVGELLLGSNARQILIHAKCDVLLANH